MNPSFISIIGCGWLGLPEAEYFIQKGQMVNGTCTSQSKLELLQNKGINASLFQVDFDKDIKIFDEKIFNVSNLLITIPPSLNKYSEGHYLKIINLILQNTNPETTKVIFCSSTSIYPSNNQWVDEETAISEANTEHPILYQAEKLIQQHNEKNLILRLGGLVGKDRMLYRYFINRDQLPFNEEPVNLIHIDDAKAIIYQLVIQNYSGIFNIVSPLHPSKKEFYTELANRFNYKTPEFSTTQAYKIVATDKLKKVINYQYIFKDPLLYTYEV